MNTTFFNTDLALVQAPMAGVQDARLAVAVCESGGLGSLPCAMLSEEQLIEQLNYITTHTSKPYNLNFFCHQTEEYTQEQQAQWHALLAPYFSELNLDAAKLATTTSRKPITEQIVDLIAPYKPPVVSFHFGLPSAAIVEQIKAWGGQVWSSATTVDEALWLEANGADAIILQGTEAGGHRGHFLSHDLSLQPSTKQLLTACRDLAVPLIVAGGIATPEQVKHFLRAGAQAVQIGSAFLLCEEATTSLLHREALKNAEDGKTEITTVFSGRPARGIRNRIMSEIGAMPQQAPPFPYASIALTALRSNAEAKGDSGFSPLWCGEHFIAREGKSAKEIVTLLMQE